MKTNTIKRFEKDLKDHGYEFELVKELRYYTRYNITKDGFTFRNFEACNVIDKPGDAIKFFEKMFDMNKKLYEYENRNERQIWKVTVNGNIQTACYVAAASKEEAISKANENGRLIYNCAVIEEEY